MHTQGNARMHARKGEFAYLSALPLPPPPTLTLSHVPSPERKEMEKRANALHALTVVAAVWEQATAIDATPAPGIDAEGAKGDDVELCCGFFRAEDPPDAEARARHRAGDTAKMEVSDDATPLDAIAVQLVVKQIVTRVSAIDEKTKAATSAETDSIDRSAAAMPREHRPAAEDGRIASPVEAHENDDDAAGRPKRERMTPRRLADQAEWSKVMDAPQRATALAIEEAKKPDQDVSVSEALVGCKIRDCGALEALLRSNDRLTPGIADTTIGVWWSADRSFYHGRIERYEARRPGGKNYFLRYDDGETAWLNLAEEILDVTGLVAKVDPLALSVMLCGNRTVRHISLDYSKLVKQRLGVWWPQHRKFFYGRVTHYSERSRKFRFEYEHDGFSPFDDLGAWVLDVSRAELMRRSQDTEAEKQASPRKGPKSPSRAKSPWMPYGMAKALVQSMAFKSKEQFTRWLKKDAPDGFPLRANIVYHTKGFVSWEDFLGLPAKPKVPGAHAFGIEMEGKNFHVWWQRSKRFFTGLVVEYDPSRPKPHLIEYYVDGETKWTDLSKSKLEPVEAGLAYPDFLLEDERAMMEQRMAVKKKLQTTGTLGSPSPSPRKGSKPKGRARKGGARGGVRPASSYGLEMEGKRLRVFFPEAKAWYTSLVVDYDPHRGRTHLLKYLVDGATKWQDLSKTRFKIVEDDSYLDHELAEIERQRVKRGELELSTGIKAKSENNKGGKGKEKKGKKEGGRKDRGSKGPGGIAKKRKEEGTLQAIGGENVEVVKSRSGRSVKAKKKFGYVSDSEQFFCGAGGLNHSQPRDETAPAKPPRPPAYVREAPKDPNKKRPRASLKPGPSKLPKKSASKGIGARARKSFGEVRDYARNLNIRNPHRYAQLYDEGKLMKGMPKDPSVEYAQEGWVSWPDFLNQRGWQDFEAARRYARKLGCSSQDEWIQYCQFMATPADIPTNPEKVYENQGWGGWEDFLKIPQGTPRAKPTRTMAANGERGLTVAVVCNGLKGEFEPATRRFYVATGGNGGSQMMAFTPTEFERHAGMAASKKWKYSVRIDVDAIPGFDWDVVQLGPYTLGRWLQEKGLDSKGVRKGGHATTNGAGREGTPGDFWKAFKRILGTVDFPIHEEFVVEMEREGMGADVVQEWIGQNIWQMWHINPHLAHQLDGLLRATNQVAGCSRQDHLLSLL